MNPENPRMCTDAKIYRATEVAIARQNNRVPLDSLVFNTVLIHALLKTQVLHAYGGISLNTTDCLTYCCSDMVIHKKMELIFSNSARRPMTSTLSSLRTAPHSRLAY